MPSPKARFLGSKSGEELHDFAPRLKVQLRGFYPKKDAKPDPVGVHPADAFVEAVVAAARNALAALHWHRLRITKQEMRAEHAANLKALKAASSQLRSLSIDYDRLLGPDAAPLEWADAIDAWIRTIEGAGPRIAAIPPGKKPQEVQHQAAIQLANDVLPVLKRYGIKTSATSDKDSNYISVAVKVLKAIGDDMRMNLSATTWRDTIRDAKAITKRLAKRGG